MSSGTTQTWSSMSRSMTRSKTWSSISSRSRPTSSSTRCSFVESNFHIVMPETPILPEVHIKPRAKSRGTREITINETPMMLLPKARVRENLDLNESVRHSYGVVADTSTQGLHLSTIPAVYPMNGRRPSPKSALKSGRRTSSSRSDADSGIGSLKRAVTFDNLSRSQSTVFRSQEEIDDLSDGFNDDVYDLDTVDATIFRNFNLDDEDLPDYLDTFGGENDAIIANILPHPPLRPPSRNSLVSIDRFGSGRKRGKHRLLGGNDGNACEICGTYLSEKERIEKTFGKVDSFLKWVMSKWGPLHHDELRKELQYIPRPTYVYRGHTPHFCNFVHQAHLHSKHLRETTDSTGIPDSEIEDDIDYIESFEGRIVGKYRKGSNTSLASSASGSVNGLVPLPNLEDYVTEPVQDSIPEMKEDLAVSGTEGRPASPSSVDGDDQNDESGLPITGIEVKVTTPLKSGPSVKIPVLLDENKLGSDDKNLYGSGDKLVIHEEDGEGNGGLDADRNMADYRRKSVDKSRTDKGADQDSSNNNTRVPSPSEPPPSPDTAPIKRKSVDRSKTDRGADQDSSNNNTRVPSPSEPPPSPDTAPIKLPINKPKPPEVPPPKERKRSCVNKKTRKSIDRSRRMKEPGETPPAVETPQPVVEPEPTAVETESEKPDSKLELKVPELPSSADTEKKQRKEKSKPKRHLIDAGDEQPKDIDPVELLNEQNRQIRSEIDWSTMDTNGLDDTNKRQPQIKSWIQGRLALSQQASRFELPMDMKRLEKMTPQEYVKTHCIITSRRNNLYQKIFLKNKDKTHAILYKDLDKTLKEVLVNTITSDQIGDILRLLEVDEQTKVDFKLFAGMAAYAERVLYPKYVTEDTVDMPEYQKEKIECADFSALDWKFHGVNVNPQMKTLLKQIS